MYAVQHNSVLVQAMINFPHMGSMAVTHLIHVLISALYKLLFIDFLYYLFNSLLTYFFQNRPIPFPGQMS